ncbi:prenylcysteine oxidase-like isoform X1 [Stegostoma tigrinum]|uniref:prenylcysteine oxidase-like isoform X1 n=1 Tax=Stegostoma tigrinum TaxID=3053191 RepID=UPI00202AE6C1|nr:prenylcysteine oxidase-like isoform X1 [Stegostoma tigrinum]
MAGSVLLTCTLLLRIAVTLSHQEEPPPKKIAVVGAGIGGSSAAYFLRREFGHNVKIDVYEKGTIGGRLATVTVNGQQYEIGGSVIHPLNLHMQDFVKHLGLKHRKGVPEKLALFNGEEFVFEETDWYLQDLFKMWWRYGFGLLRLQMWVEEIVEKFMRIYKYQAHGYAFSTMEEMLQSLGGDRFINMTRRPVAETLQELGISQRFIDEIVTAIMRVNYGQSVTIPAFVGAVSIAGVQAGLWAVEGGNKLVCSQLLDSAKVNVVHTTVTSISLHSSGDKSLYQVNYENENEGGYDFYDIVVIATPLHRETSNISFSGMTPPVTDFPGHYQHMIVSIVHGYLNSSYFGFPDPKLFPFAAILTTDSPKLFMFSTGCICPVNITSNYRRKQPQEAAVWKVFSPSPLTKEQLKTLFLSYYSVQVTDWLAYPQYTSMKGIPPVILHDNLYYLNGVEWIASSMEMSAIAAKNIALLGYNRWHQQLDKIDQKDLVHKIKTEL